jgi:hypothetical protein
VDQALLLARVTDNLNDPRRALLWAGGRCTTPPKLLIELSGDQYQLLEPTQQPSAVAASANPLARVRAALSNTPQTVEQLAKASGLKVPDVRDALAQLEKVEKIVTKGTAPATGSKGRPPATYCLKATEPVSIPPDLFPTPLEVGVEGGNKEIQAPAKAGGFISFPVTPLGAGGNGESGSGLPAWLKDWKLDKKFHAKLDAISADQLHHPA